MDRRTFLKTSAAAMAAGAVATRAAAQAQNWPERPVKLIVPYAPGGASDIVARPWADALSQSFGQQFIVENRGGAAGMIGCEAAAQATPDGYTFLLTPSAALSVLPLLRKTPYDPQKSFVPVARIADSISGFVIHPSVGPKTLKETIDYARANPGKLSYGSAGLGSIQHMRIEMLKYRTGVDILHVPYRGAGEALTDLLANNIQMMCEINPLPHAKAGKLNLLCINHVERSPEFPDTPTLTECGYPNSDLPSWYAVWAQPKAPDAILDKFHARIVDIAKSDEMKAKMRQVSAALRIQTRAEISKFLVDDMSANAELIKAASIKLE
jgi:tripartite-type tricarboxylate transporter receptor subunit TctC